MFVKHDVRDFDLSWTSMFVKPDVRDFTFHEPLLVTLFRHSVSRREGETKRLASRLPQLFCCSAVHSLLCQAPSVIGFVLYSRELAVMHFVLPTVVRFLLTQFLILYTIRDYFTFSMPVFHKRSKLSKLWHWNWPPMFRYSLYARGRRSFLPRANEHAKLLFRVSIFTVRNTGGDDRTSWNSRKLLVASGPGSSVGIATGYGLGGPGSNTDGGEIFRTGPDWPCGPPSLLYYGYRVFLGGKEGQERDADPSPPSSAVVKKE